MKLVFFVNIVRQARCIRRIEDFIGNGYNVDVFGFDRDGDNRKLPSFSHKIIGCISRSTSYFNRLKMMCRAIKNVLKSQDRDVVYYLFSLDVALAFFIAGGSNRKYIYEVSDLMELEVNNSILSKVLIIINRHIINKSLETIMTSPGFADFYFGENIPSHISILPNKLNRKVLNLPKPAVRYFDEREIAIGFTGAIRSKAVYNFIEVVGNHFPNIKIRFHGIFTDDKIYGKKIQAAIQKYANVEYYGTFKNPDDFPEIYSHIDLVLSLYTSHGNDKVLEPNKLYEAIFYEKPIVVSENTYTGDYVKNVQIGYTVNGEDCNSIMNFLNSLTREGYEQRVQNCKQIPKSESVDNVDALFDKLSKKII